MQNDNQNDELEIIYDKYDYDEKDMKSIYDKYYHSDNRFDLDAFNKNFNTMKEEVKRYYKRKDENKLNEMNETRIKNITITQFIYNLVNTWLVILKQINELDFNDIIKDNNRMFYIGSTFIIVSLILFIMNHNKSC